MASILDFVPAGFALRDGQRDVLLEVERLYRSNDIVVLRLPVAFGKTIIALTIAAWRASMDERTSYVVPNNVLVSEVKAKFPNIAVMERRSAYRCEPFDRDCDTTAKRCKKLCPDCPFKTAKTRSKTASVVLQNTYVYWSHENFTRNVIFDEAHLLLDTLDGLGSVRIWKRDFRFPANLATLADVVEWIQEERKHNPDARLKKVLEQLLRIKGGSEVRYNWEKLRGKEELVLHVVPDSIRSIPGYLWPSKVRKMVMMSATIGPKEIYDMGLDHRRVAYIDGASPIPVENRPVFYWPRVNLSYKLLHIALPELAKAIRELLDRYPTKGIIHMPYSIAQQLKPLLQHDRILYHDKENKSATLTLYKESSPESGKVLIASGLYEGISLDEDLARWQCISKVPYLSLGDPKIAERLQTDHDWYDWAAIKRLSQAYGRVCRGPTDSGVTIIIDSNFERLWNKDQQRNDNTKLFPSYFRDAYKRVPLK